MRADLGFGKLGFVQFSGTGFISVAGTEFYCLSKRRAAHTLNPPTISTHKHKKTCVAFLGEDLPLSAFIPEAKN